MLLLDINGKTSQLQGAKRRTEGGVGESKHFYEKGHSRDTAGCRKTHRGREEERGPRGGGGGVHADSEDQ